MKDIQNIPYNQFWKQREAYLSLNLTTKLLLMSLEIKYVGNVCCSLWLSSAQSVYVVQANHSGGIFTQLSKFNGTDNAKIAKCVFQAKLSNGNQTFS